MAVGHRGNNRRQSTLDNPNWSTVVMQTMYFWELMADTRFSARFYLPGRLLIAQETNKNMSCYYLSIFALVGSPLHHRQKHLSDWKALKGPPDRWSTATVSLLNALTMYSTFSTGIPAWPIWFSRAMIFDYICCLVHVDFKNPVQVLLSLRILSCR